MRGIRGVRAFGVLTAAAATLAIAAADPAPVRTGFRCLPISQRTSEVGCWIVAEPFLGKLPAGPLFWHIDSYPTSAAADAAKGSRGTVVESLGKVWLFAIADASWAPGPGGTHIANVGPLPLFPADGYTATYMEAVFEPGMQSSIHRHSGLEAWYLLSGEQCLETSEGTQVGRAGDTDLTVRAGLPMLLTGTGSEKRRSLVLVLHDASEPQGSLANDWTPKGLCSSK